MFLYSGALSGEATAMRCRRQWPAEPGRSNRGFCINSTVAVPKRRHKLLVTEIKSSQDEHAQPMQIRLKSGVFPVHDKGYAAIDMQYQLFERNTITRKKL